MVALVIIFLLMAEVPLQTWFLVSDCPLQGQCDLGALLGYGKRTGKQIGARI